MIPITTLQSLQGAKGLKNPLSLVGCCSCEFRGKRLIRSYTVTMKHKAFDEVELFGVAETEQFSRQGTKRLNIYKYPACLE